MPKRDDTFLLYYWSDFEQFESDNPSCIYCLSESTVQIILSALRFSGWRTRWRLNKADNSRAISDAAVWDKIDAMAALAQKEIVGDMSCDFAELGQNIADAIVQASNATAMEHLAQAVQAIANKPCCNDSVNVTVNGGVVSEWTDGDGINHPIYGTQPPATNDGETPPEGFETYEDYLLNKCQVANMVFDGWLLTMRGLGGLTIFNATALATLIGLSLGPMIIFPPAAIPVAIGALIVLGSAVVMFHQICDSLEDNREQIVCDLYNSTTVEDLTAVLAEAIDSAISLLEVSGPIGAALSLVALTLVNSDTLSQLMSGVAGVSYPGADCSSCGGCVPVTEAIAGSAEIDGDTLTITPLWIAGQGQYRADVLLKDSLDSGVYCGKWLTLISSDGITDSGTPPIYEFWGQGNSVQVYASDTPPAQAYHVDGITIRSSTAGTVVFTMSEVEP